MFNPSQFAWMMQTDPVGRGLVSAGPGVTRFGPEHLAGSARFLSDQAKRIGIVTGFAVPTPSGPVAETDGPPGACLLADCLLTIGKEVTLITDDFCAPVVESAADIDVPGAGLLVLTSHSPSDCLEEYRQSFAEPLDVLIAIERVGPVQDGLRTENSGIRRQNQMAADGPDITSQNWQALMLNVRGDCIAQWTRPLHVLFETQDSTKTIGIGDGGNEIGMGVLAAEELRERLGSAVDSFCRIKTDWTLIAGTSNWGAFALAATTAVLAGHGSWMSTWPVQRHEQLLQRMCEIGGAVDGMTCRAEPTVDGLSFEDYIMPWQRILP